MKLTPYELEIFDKILAPENNHLDAIELARIANLKPEICFIGGNWDNVNFGDKDLSNYNFSRADLRRANLTNVRGLDSIIVDQFTLLPANLRELIENSSARENMLDAQHALRQNLTYRAGLFAQRAVDKYKKAKNYDKALEALIFRTKTVRSKGDREFAIRLYIDMIQLAKRTGNKNCLVDATHEIGRLHLAGYEFRSAEKRFEESLKLCESHGFLEKKRQILIDIARSKIAIRDYEKARSLIRTTSDLNFESDNNFVNAKICQLNGEIAAGQSKFREAIQNFEDALELLYLEKNHEYIKRDIADIKQKSSFISEAIGDLDAALIQANEALKIYISLESSADIFECSNIIISIINKQSDQVKLIYAHKKRIELLYKITERDPKSIYWAALGSSLTKLADYYANDEEHDLAIKDYTSAIFALQRGTNNQLSNSAQNISHLHMKLGKVFLSINDLDQAAKNFALAMRTALKYKDRATEKQATYLLENKCGVSYRETISKIEPKIASHLYGYYMD